MAGSEAAIKPAIVLFGSSSEAEIAVRIKENLAWSAELLPAKRVMLTGVNDAAPLRVAIAGGLDALFLEEVSAVVLRRSFELVLLGERLYPAALFDASQQPVPGAIAPSHAPAMQDGAPGHASKETREELHNRDIYPIYWPAFSPDLNPIEAVWNWMKDWIQEQYPNDEQLSYDRLREVVRASWDALPEQYLKDLIESMQARCEAVIAAGGGHTKY